VNFYFEVKLDTAGPGGMGFEANPVYTFDTAEGKAISDLLTDYAMALLREMGLNPDGSRRVRARDRAAAAAAAEKAASGASAAATADAVPTRSAMASSADAYRAVGGDVGALATAATRSGEYTDAAGAAHGGSSSGSGAAPPPPPPPPPSFNAPPPPPPPPAAGGAHAPASPHVAHAPPPAAAPAEPPLPAPWTQVRDDESGDFYFFNTVTGASVWERSEVS
jgi:hypothetical protein